MFLIRLLLLPFKIVFALLGFTLKVGYRTGKLPVVATTRTFRLPGFKGWFFLLVGIALGLLLAPGPGRELREKLKKRLAGESVPDIDLRDKVAFELAHAPRTWHLDQPDVTVVNGVVTLRGTVADGETRDELARVARSTPGVAAVDTDLTITTLFESIDA